MPPASDWIWWKNPAQRAEVEQILSYRPEAIVCANDITAAMLIRTLTNMGLNVPRDLRVVGFDDLRYATLLPVALTTIHQPCRQIGRVAMQMMMERINDPSLPPRQTYLPTRLVVRESCGAWLSAPTRP